MSPTLARSQPAAPRGFSLVECLMVVAVLATLCASSLPTFAAISANSRARSTNEALIASLNLARNAAVTRGDEVVVCPSTDQTRCDAANWWQHGWIVFQDKNHNARRDPDEPLFQVEPAHTAIALATSTGREHVTYRIDGSATGTNLTFTLCDARGPAHASTVVVSNTGRPRRGVPNAAEANAACAGLAKG